MNEAEELKQARDLAAHLDEAATLAAHVRDMLDRLEEESVKVLRDEQRRRLQKLISEGKRFGWVAK